MEIEPGKGENGCKVGREELPAREKGKRAFRHRRGGSQEMGEAEQESAGEESRKRTDCAQKSGEKDSSEEDFFGDGYEETPSRPCEKGNGVPFETDVVVEEGGNQKRQETGQARDEPEQAASKKWSEHGPGEADIPPRADAHLFSEEKKEEKSRELEHAAKIAFGGGRIERA